MSLDLTGIINENEFYTHHYLSAILENDLKDVIKSWKSLELEQEIKPPYSRIRGISSDFFKVRQTIKQAKSPQEVMDNQEGLLIELLDILGYEYRSDIKELEDGRLLPVISEVTKGNGSPELWIIQTIDFPSEDNDPLELTLFPCQYPEDIEDSKQLLEDNFEEIVTKRIFGFSEPPRWLILIGDSQIVLLDRTKWNEKRSIRFDLDEIMGRRENSTLQVTCCLLHRDSLCPKEGICVLDTFDENSHKHAYSVSEDLKFALRESIELLGNEAVYYLKQQHERIYERDLAGQLTLECLRYMYRLLFVFYLEARPELGYLPMKSEVYRKGYSLESLRDLELTQLTTSESEEGFYISHSISRLFNMIFNGFPRYVSNEKKGELLYKEEKPDHDTFKITPLKCHLFDPQRTPLLSKVKFRNKVLQRVIELMSLSRPGNGNKRRGRISYSQLGINQLGAVYEALLCYRGFFAETDLYEVKKSGDTYSELDVGYFVKAEELPKYEDNEKVYNEDGTLRKYYKGAFIYRLAGRERQESASYYTPEVLTQCLVKYALKELLKGKTADEILQLTVCEPAMGSAAFLNEAVNQLAEAYLDLKKKETGLEIKHDEYATEKQKVKMYIADNNVFGVDLNPIAVELAEVSLWLNTIYKGAYVPWFGMQLACGNSLIGARRQVYDKSLLKKLTREDPLWFELPPKRVEPGIKRPSGMIYHFLLSDKGMASCGDKVIKTMMKSEVSTMRIWNKAFTKEFSDTEIKLLERLSEKVDRLWEAATRQQNKIRERTDDFLQVWGQNVTKKEPELSSGVQSGLFDRSEQMTFNENSFPKVRTTREKDEILDKERNSKEVRNSSSYRRLKMVMDYWCALWFWPIDQAELLPSREEYLMEMSLILDGNLMQETKAGQGELFPSTMTEREKSSLLDEFGVLDLDELCDRFPRLGLVQTIAEENHFLHWELEFADIFEKRGGFDLIVGNPPWLKVEWKEGDILGDYEPLYVIRKLSAPNLAKLRQEAIEKYGIRNDYLGAFVKAEGTQNFLNAFQNYPSLKGMQTNLFKCFLPQAWMIGSQIGISGFLHPEGVYDDPKGGVLRREIFPRLSYHFQFQNELKLFQDVHHETKFSINVYWAKLSSKVFFRTIANLFHPETIEECFNSTITQKVPAIKDENGKWNTVGHPSRVIRITEIELEIFAFLFDVENTPTLEAQMPAVHTKEVIEVLSKFVEYENHFIDFREQYKVTVMWDETNRQNDGTILRDTHYPLSSEKVILSGPHLFLGNPLNKSARKVCKLNSDYDVVDLETISTNYLPRTNYAYSCEETLYQSRIPSVSWDDLLVTNFYRFAYRKMLGLSLERTLIGAIIPPGFAHIHGIQTTAFTNIELLLSASFFSLSIVADFFIKSTGRTNLNLSWEHFPYLELFSGACIRVLLLNCLTSYYANLWNESWNDQFNSDSWTKSDCRLDNSRFRFLKKEWNWDIPLRSYYERRQALVEIDVLSSRALGLTLDELKTIYRIQFPVLQQYERETYYDQKGRIVFTVNRGLPGVGFSRAEWNDIKGMKSGTVEQTIVNDTLPGGPRERVITYYAPFDKCDREEDYETAWKEFERRKREGK